MSWCAKCFTAQTTSDFESEDDGEYEYFVNSRYICKRKKTVESSNQGPTVVEASSAMSHTGESVASSLQNCSKVRSDESQEEEVQARCGSSGKSPSVASACLKEGKVWQVAHATIDSTIESCSQPFFDTSTSDSDRILDHVFDAAGREARIPSQETNLPDHPSQVLRANSLTTTATSMVTIDNSPVTITPKKRPGFLRRLFGLSGKPSPFPEYDIHRMRSSIFKETMELPSPADATKNLFWTVRVKLK